MNGFWAQKPFTRSGGGPNVVHSIGWGPLPGARPLVVNVRPLGMLLTGSAETSLTSLLMGDRAVRLSGRKCVPHSSTNVDAKGDTVSEETLENLVHEGRTFPPAPEFAAQANGTADLYEQGRRRPRGFLGRAGPQLPHVEHALHAVARLGNPPFAKWFADGELNACVQRRRPARRGRQRRQGRDPLRR